MNTGGIVPPEALMKKRTVVGVPLSAEEICPTCFVPRTAITFGGFVTVMHPVSSRFHIMFGSKLCVWYNFSKFEKKIVVFVLLKLEVLLNDVLSG